MGKPSFCNSCVFLVGGREIKAMEMVAVCCWAKVPSFFSMIVEGGSFLKYFMNQNPVPGSAMGWVSKLHRRMLRMLKDCVGA